MHAGGWDLDRLTGPDRAPAPRAVGWPSSDDDRLDVVAMFAARITRAPQSITATDIERLRSIGLTDRDILELISLIGYYNCVNRVAAGLALR